MKVGPTQQRDITVANTFLKKVRVWPVLLLYTMHLNSSANCQYPEISSSLDVLQQETLKQSHVKEKSSKWIQNMQWIYYN